jgi:hypothetical protein
VLQYWLSLPIDIKGDELELQQMLQDESSCPTLQNETKVIVILQLPSGAVIEHLKVDKSDLAHLLASLCVVYSCLFPFDQFQAYTAIPIYCLSSCCHFPLSSYNKPFISFKCCKLSDFGYHCMC